MLYDKIKDVSPKKTILVVEDDGDLSFYLKKILSDWGYKVDVLSRGAQVLPRLGENPVDLVLLDLKLPDIQGLSLAKEIKETYPSLALIILTAQNQTHNIVQGFNFGADDYITKPFNNEELLARIKTRLKRGNEVLNLADLELDNLTKSVFRKKQKIKLTKTEFNLLKYLLINKKQVLSRDMILSQVWGYDNDVNTRVVDVYMAYLRKKVDKNFKPKLIHSIRGFGYMLDAR